MEFVKEFENYKHDRRDPDPWMALFFDTSVPLDKEVKAALLACMRSKSRQILLPIVRPIARTAIVLIQLYKNFVPKAFTSSRLLHKLIHWGLKTWVKPEANFLIMRHFHIGSEALAFIAKNTPNIEIPSNPLRPKCLDDLLDDFFLKHDLNLYNFIIDINTQLQEKGLEIKKAEKLNLDVITDEPFPIELPRKRWTNFIDLQTAIEIYTPVYQLFLTENDFWRASNSLQLDETIGIYVAKIIDAPQHLVLVNNKHPLIPMSTMEAGFRLVLHGLSAEYLHALLRQLKRQLKAASSSTTLTSKASVEVTTNYVNK